MPTLNPAAPTEDEIYAASRLKWRKLGVTDSSGLTEALTQACAYIVTMTGRVFSDWPTPTSFTDSMPLAATPELIPLARQATKMRVEQIVEQEQPGYISTVTDDALLSMSVGPYSETRRDPTRRGEGKILNLWTGLNDLLWALMTDERYDFWIAYTTGAHAPAFAVEEVNWGLIGNNAMVSALEGTAVGDPYAPWTMLL